MYEGPSLSKTMASSLPSARAERILRTDFGVLRKKQTDNTGNCFFDSVKKSADLAQTMEQLRTDASNSINPALQADQEWLEPFIVGHGTPQQKLTELQTKVRQDRYWAGRAGDFVPYMMARALDRAIYILSGYTGKLITVAGDGPNPIYVFYNGANHYEASERVE